jgi:short-chain fatty acids transporter
MVGLTQTTFRPFNLLFVAATVAASIVLLMGMHPPAESCVVMQARTFATAQEDESKLSVPRPPADRLSESRLLVWLIVAAAAVFLVPFFARSGIVGLDLNVVNFAFLMLGLLLHGSLGRYARDAADGARAASAVIVQFPFYAGIMGIMVNSGLVKVIATAFIAISTPLTFPFWVMMSAAAINIAIPSGGGQWAVQGPIIIEAAKSLEVDIGKTIMALAMGDQITNMMQPFWALPLLGITGLKAGQVLGYTVVVMIAALAISAITLTFVP